MSRQLVANPKSRSTSNRNGKTIPGATLVMASPRAHEVLAKILRGISDPSHLAKDATDRAKVVKKATTTNPSMDIMAKAASTNRSRKGQSILLLCPIQPKDSHQNLHGDRLSQACRRCHRSHRRLHHIPDSQAAQTLTKLTAAIKKKPDQYDAEVHAILQGASMVEGLNAKDQMLKAAEDLGSAGEALDAARLGRYQNHIRWRDFLTSAASRWQEYTADFQQQEKDFSEAIEQAKAVMANARERFESGKAALSEDDQAAFLGEVADVSMADRSHDNVSGHALQENLETMAANLQTLQKSARRNLSRPRNRLQRDHVLQKEKVRRQRLPPGSLAEMPWSPLRSGKRRLFKSPASSDKCVHLLRAADCALCAANCGHEMDTQNLQKVGLFE